MLEKEYTQAMTEITGMNIADPWIIPSPSLRVNDEPNGFTIQSSFRWGKPWFGQRISGSFKWFSNGSCREHVPNLATSILWIGRGISNLKLSPGSKVAIRFVEVGQERYCRATESFFDMTSNTMIRKAPNIFHPFLSFWPCFIVSLVHGGEFGFKFAFGLRRAGVACLEWHLEKLQVNKDFIQKTKKNVRRVDRSALQSCFFKKSFNINRRLLSSEAIFRRRTTFFYGANGLE